MRKKKARMEGARKNKEKKEVRRVGKKERGKEKVTGKGKC